MKRRMPLTERGRRLASMDRADHPNAAESRCLILRAHDPHPFGPILPAGGLAWWCPGSQAVTT
jgi:hypothetical protein